MAALEHLGQHPVVESRDGARVLVLDGGKDAGDVHMLAQPHAGQAAVCLQQQDRHLGYA
ncbi:hypothetical protein D3C75_985450 [compost metagenome]